MAGDEGCHLGASVSTATAGRAKRNAGKPHTDRPAFPLLVTVLVSLAPASSRSGGG
jgi:hypothetical protein